MSYRTYSIAVGGVLLALSWLAYAAIWAPSDPLCSDVPELATVATISPSDFSGDLCAAMATHLGSGGGLELLGGVYSASCIVGGGISGMTVDINPSASYEVRAADPDDPPILKAVIGQNVPVLLHVNASAGVEGRFRNIVIDGLKSQQTNAVFSTQSGINLTGSVCDDDDADGICDADDPTSFTFAGGLMYYSTTGTPAVGCVENVTVRDVVWNAFQCQGCQDVVVENWKAEDAGCGLNPDTECPNIDVPVNNSSKLMNDARGLNITGGSSNLGIYGEAKDVTKIGAQISNSPGTELWYNKVELTGAACFASNNIVADEYFYGNTGNKCGWLHQPGRPGSIGYGFHISTGASPSVSAKAYLFFNRVTNIWGVPYVFQDNSGLDRLSLLAVGNSSLDTNQGFSYESALQYQLYLSGLANAEIINHTSPSDSPFGVYVHNGPPTILSMINTSFLGSHSFNGARFFDSVLTVNGLHVGGNIEFTSSASGTANTCTATLVEDNSSGAMSGDCL